MRLLLPLLIACAGPPPGPSAAEESALYAALVANPDPDPDRDLPRCARLSEPAMMGDCQLAVAQNAAAARDVPPETWCPLVTDTTFRNECHFIAAEVRVKRGQRGEAVALCRQAGSFDLDCAQHLWQRPVLRAVRGHDDRELAALLPEGQALFDAWAPHLAQHTDFDRRFWRYWYGAFFERAKALPMAPCAQLAPGHQVRCEYAIAHIYLRRLRDRLGHRQGRAALCKLPTPTPAAAAQSLPGMGAEDHPLLRAVIAEQQAQLCQEGDAGPVEDGVLGPSAWDAAVAQADASAPPVAPP